MQYLTKLQSLVDTWRTDVKPQDIEGSINNAAPGKLRVLSVSQVILRICFIYFYFL